MVALEITFIYFLLWPYLFLQSHSTVTKLIKKMIKICAFRAKSIFLGEPLQQLVSMFLAVVDGREAKADFQKWVKNSWRLSWSKVSKWKVKKENGNIKAANDMDLVSWSLRFLFLSEIIFPGCPPGGWTMPSGSSDIMWFPYKNPGCPAVGRMSVGQCGQQEDFYMSASPS